MGDERGKPIGVLHKIQEHETGETVLVFKPTGELGDFWEAAKASGMHERTCSTCGRLFLTRTDSLDCPPCENPALEGGRS